MASSKTRSAARSARSAEAVSATPTSRRFSKPPRATEPETVTGDPAETEEAAAKRPAGQPLWLQAVTLVLAVAGLGISAYETWAHFNGNHLAGCPSGGGGTFNCSAVITSPQSMVFNVIPVAVLGLAFYVVAVPIFSPWAWRLPWRQVHLFRLVSMIVGMGFVVYLIYAELQVGSVCEYCTGVHVVTFLLFCVTVVSAAIWGVSGRQPEQDLG